mgnify:CR=1 FL=1
MSWLKKLLAGSDLSMIPSPSSLQWDRRKAALSYFILHHLRDQRLPKEVHFHPDDFRYNAILNEMVAEAGFEVPPPADTDRYVRDEGVTEWFPRYFPDKDGGELIASTYKAGLVSLLLETNVEFLNGVAEKFAVPFPPHARVKDLRPGHVYFVKYGYVTYYHYLALTDQREDPLGFREWAMSEAITRQFPKSLEDIEWWLEIIALLNQFHRASMPVQPEIAQIRVDIALDIIRTLTTM